MLNKTTSLPTQKNTQILIQLYKHELNCRSEKQNSRHTHTQIETEGRDRGQDTAHTGLGRTDPVSLHCQLTHEKQTGNEDTTAAKALKRMHRERLKGLCTKKGNSTKLKSMMLSNISYRGIETLK